jgi:hypothetical protein
VALRRSAAQGFLGTGPTFEADLNLVVQLIMGAALIVALFSRQERWN